jgi:glucose-6-phosphate 1-dehydrogenase
MEKNVPILKSEATGQVLSFFAIPNNLAYPLLCPALQAMIRRDHLDVPIIGMARRRWSIDSLRALTLAQPGRAEASVAEMRRILEAILAQDGTAASHACIAHVEQAAQVATAVLQQRELKKN